MVDWDKVNKSPFKISSGNRKKLENCNYVIELAQKLQFAITGVSGQHIREGNPTFILGKIVFAFMPTVAHMQLSLSACVSCMHIMLMIHAGAHN